MESINYFSALKITISLFLANAVVMPLSAEEIYKSVGSDGVVFYSNMPEASSQNTETIEVFPEPAAETILAAQQELARIRQDAVDQKEAATEKAFAAGQAEEVKKVAPRLFNPFIGLAPFVAPPPSQGE